ncbi:adenosine deaminase/editase [Scheffersomyces amazonensis]|uniref:adenosine deaminase/editase n=1 Tax=Scheffersomyces amazonensis TaxID=1078765 RepID=UPI00315D40FF
MVDGNVIADKVFSTFNGLKLKSGKPVVRSNGVKEWTVLASLVAQINDEILPITLTTGVKALPDKVRHYSQGRIVHDLHAEILSLRLFNWYLLDECCKLCEGDYKSKLIEKIDEEKFRIKVGVSFHLLITEPPCGDASMLKLASETDDKQVWSDESQPHKMQKIEGNRGRSNFGKLGVIRTKPGRGDSLPTLSKSCSDKLSIKQIVGLTNAFTADLFPDGIFLNSLILKEDSYLEDDIERCFRNRLIDVSDLSPHFISVLKYNSNGYTFGKEKDAVPSNLSLLHLVESNITQVLNNGVKNGSFIKNKIPKEGGESFISNYQFYLKLLALKPLVNKNYSEFKRQNQQRELVKQRSREILGPWNPTSEDNFDFV